MTKELENKISKLLNDKNYEEALKLCDNAIKSNSEDFQIYIYRGLAKNNLNRYEEAIEDYNASLKLNSNNPDTYYFIGLSKDNLGLYEEAINNYDKAIELNPAYIYPYIRKIDILEKLNSEEIFDFIRKCLYLNSEPLKNRILQFNLSKIEKYDKDINKVNDCFEKTDYKELKNKLDNVNAVYDKIKQQEEKINSIHNDIITKNTAIINSELAAYFNQKVNDLEKNLNKFSKTFIFMVIVDIISIIGLFCLNMSLTNFKNDNIFFDIRISILSIGIIGLSLWITKYFNRRTHETVQLKEDYEHKSLVLSSFLSYSKELEKLSETDKQFLLDYISKVSSTINKSPASNLNKRKGDNTPIEDLSELLSHLSGLINSKKN